MKKQNVLFVCIHNSARSQMAEAFLNELGKERYQAQSAGIEPGKLNPYVVKVMAEIGYDISHNKTNSVQEFLDNSKQIDIVITVCDETSAESCPVFPGKVKRLHWSFADPSAISGTEEEKFSSIRKIRDLIKNRVIEWLGEK